MDRKDLCARAARKMKEIFLPFGVTQETLDLLQENKAVVAGGSVAHSLRRAADPSDATVAHFDGDIDIWVNSTEARDRILAHFRSLKYKSSPGRSFDGDTRPQDGTFEYAGTKLDLRVCHLHAIRSMNCDPVPVPYFKSLGLVDRSYKVQVILVNGFESLSVESFAERVIDSFDYSCCRAFWIPGSKVVQGPFVLFSALGGNYAFKGYTPNKNIEEMRRIKYESRGFVFCTADEISAFPLKKTGEERSHPVQDRFYRLSDVGLGELWSELAELSRLITLNEST